MSSRRKVVLAAALAFSIWGFVNDASTAEPRDKPLPPFAKFAKGIFSGNQQPDTTASPGEIIEKSAVTTSHRSIPVGSPQGLTEVATPTSTTLTTGSVPVVNPSIPTPRQDDSSLRATVASLKARRRNDSIFEAHPERGEGGTPTAETASQTVSQPSVERPSGPEIEVSLAELPSADLEPFSTPPYPTKVTHRGITDHAATRTESLHNALRRLQQERQAPPIPHTSIAKNQLRDQPNPTPIREAEIFPHGDVPIANAIAGDLEARRPAPVIRSSDLASRPSQKGNPLRERGPDYRSLRVSDWQEPSTHVASMATVTGPSTIGNRFFEASEQANNTIATAPVMTENSPQVPPARSQSLITDKTSSQVDNVSPTSIQNAEDTVHNPYLVDAENNSPSLEAKATGIDSSASATYFANPRPVDFSTENVVPPVAEDAYTKILTTPETPVGNFGFDSRLAGDEAKPDNMVSNTWITHVATITEEDPTLRPGLPNASQPSAVAPAQNSESDSRPTDLQISEPPLTTIRTMTIPTHSRSLIRPGRIVEVAGPSANSEISLTPTSNLESAKQEVVIDRSSDSTTPEQESSPTLPRRGPVIKPSPRPIILPRR